MTTRSMRTYTARDLQSKGGLGSALDNATSEAFYSTIKAEDIHVHREPAGANLPARGIALRLVSVILRSVTGR
jgi:hypothetical protein